MKTHNTLFIILAFTALLSCKSDDHKEEKKNSTEALLSVNTGELLDLEETTVTEADAQELTDQGPDYVRFQTNDIYRVLNPVNTSFISKSDWEFLNGRAQARYSANGSPCGTAYINAVRITMGVDLTIQNKPKTKLFFEPLYLCRTTDTPGQKDTYHLNSNAVELIYEFNGTDFSQTTFGNYVTDYKEHLRINKYFSPGFREFIESGDSNGDAISGIYPIQEFIELIDDNEDTEGVYILNTGYRTGSIFNTFTRHGLLFCPDNFTFMEQFELDEPFDKKNAIGTFTGKLADKGGLCPVDCDNVAYRRR